MSNIPTLEEMLKAGVHFGHRTSRWHPKMKPFIFGVRGGVHIIDVEQTQKMLERALEFVQNTTATGGVVLFIGTKNQLTSTVERYAQEASMPYVNNRWLGGTFTNFSEIQKLIKQFLDLKDKRDKGELKKYTKLEQLQFDRKIEELDEKIGGISSLKKLPDAMFVFDVRHEKTAILEAKKMGIKVVGICDTNVNPKGIDYIIPANDDSVASSQLMAKLIAEAAKYGKAHPKHKDAPAAKVKDTKKEAEVAEDLKVKEESKETVADLDVEINEKLAKEREEEKKS
jgi:small subunit ribosomal protein S2